MCSAPSWTGAPASAGILPLSPRPRASPASTGWNSPTPGAGSTGPSMDEVRSGRRPWTILDVLHLESLGKLVGEFGINGPERGRPDPYEPCLAPARPVARRGARPDAAEDQLHHRAVLERQRRADGQHGQDTRACRGTACWAPSRRAPTSPTPRPISRPAACSISKPSQVLMVAAHNGDLRAAKAQGLRHGLRAAPDRARSGPAVRRRCRSVLRRHGRREFHRACHETGLLNGKYTWR